MVDTSKVRMMARRSDEETINLLVELAGNVPKSGRASVAACVVYKGQIIAWGFNQKKTHPFQARFGRNCDAIYLHAETDAIKNSLRHLSEDELSRSTLYVGRAKKISPHSKRKIHGLARPCDGCAKAIAAFGIKRTVWSNDESGFSCSNAA